MGRRLSLNCFNERDLLEFVFEFIILNIQSVRAFPSQYLVLSVAPIATSQRFANLFFNKSRRSMPLSVNIVAKRRIDFLFQTQIIVMDPSGLS